MNFIDFINNYWKLILLAVVVILEIICCCLTRRNKTVLTDKGLLTDLCQYIIEAENMFKDGKDKLNYVLERYKDEHALFYKELRESVKKGRPWDVKDADEIIISVIEYLLTLPTKKGGLGRESDKR